MTSITETPVKKQRGRPMKATAANMEGTEQPKKELKSQERRGRGRPRLSLASTTKDDVPPNTTKPKRTRTADAIATGRKQEREQEKQEYKTDMQKYMKERLRHGKAQIKLDASIKQLELRLKSL